MATHTSNPHLIHFRRSSGILLALAALLLGVLYGAESAQYPDNFRRWVHVGTGVIPPGGPFPEAEQGMHHIFANPKATEGYASGDFADGSVIVYELREAQQKNGVIFEGERRRVDVMIKDSNLYKSTGGWRFERFMGNGQSQDAIHDSGASCFECHTKAKAHGYVFSQLH
ncbi:MAG TPA: cytochrome P460 family protein [Bryobacteraceae bacterium]|nr:cytochrome P460 family protein [Bryobacteraceae bacterium]